MSEYKYEIWKDGNLYLTVDENRKEADRLFKAVREIWKPRVLKMYAKITTTKLLRDNEKVIK